MAESTVRVAVFGAGDHGVNQHIPNLLANGANITGEFLLTDGGHHLGGAPLIAR